MAKHSMNIFKNFQIKTIGKNDDTEIDFYVENISKTEDHIEKLLNKITETEQENHQLDIVLNEIKIDNNMTLIQFQRKLSKKQNQKILIFLYSKY